MNTVSLEIYCECTECQSKEIKKEDCKCSRCRACSVHFKKKVYPQKYKGAKHEYENYLNSGLCESCYKAMLLRRKKKNVHDKRKSN